MFKKSSFNVEIKLEDTPDVLLYNTLTSAYGIMDLKTQELYYDFENIITSHFEELKNDINFKKLINNRFIIPDDLNEYDYLKFIGQSDKHSKEVFALTIAPTLDCNMRCPYCYEQRREGAMSIKTQELLIEFVKHYISKFKPSVFQVMWYGGEPLLELEIIEGLSKSFIELCNEMDVTYSAGIVTNGYLLSREVASVLKDSCRVNMAQITVDGIGEYHNTKRILMNGENSFDSIISNIDTAKDIIKISVRVNVDKANLENIDLLADYFINEKGWMGETDFYLAPVADYNTSNCSVKNKCLEVSEFEEIDLRIFQKKYNLNKEKMKRAFYHQSRALYCGAVKTNNFVVDPDGDLYTCWNSVGVKEKKIGSIFNKLNFNTEYIKWIVHEPKGKCLNCEMLPMCAGGCPYLEITNGEVGCEMRVVGYKERLKLAYIDYIANKVPIEYIQESEM